MENKKEYLGRVPIGAVWGVGRAMTMALQQLNILTALQFAEQTPDWLTLQRIAKPYRAIWHELNGTLVHHLSLEHRTDIGSIIKSRTFSPPSIDKNFIYSQLAKNVEAACEKARTHGVRARAITFYLKTQEFLYGRAELTLPVATNDPRDLLAVIKPEFERLYRPRTPYRATGISLRGIVAEAAVTNDLFGAGEATTGNAKVLESIDALNHRYGSKTVFMGASMQAINYRERSRASRAAKRPDKVLLPSEYKKKSIDIPFLGVTR